MGFAPTFGPRQDSTAGSEPGSLVMADFNGDGKPDGAVVNFGDNTVSVFINTPMTVQQTFAVGSAPDSIAAADLNGDGKPDLVVANSGDNTVSVLLNTTAPGATTASFAAQQTFGTGNGPASVTVADVNGDGKPDLVVANQFGNTVSVLLNTTAPGATTLSFAAQQTFATGNNPAAAAMADVNGDGRPDLIVVNNSDATLSVMLNTTAPGASTASFATQQTFATGSLPNSVAAADFNGDGKPDLVVANVSTKTVSVLLNTTAPGATTPSFAVQQTFATGNSPNSVAAADINGDGKPDVIVANGAGNTVSVLLNTTAPGAATPSFAAQVKFGTGAGPDGLAVADINGDGRPDLIVANGGGNTPGSTVSVLFNTSLEPTTTFDIKSFAIRQTFATGNAPGSVAAADLNGDGEPDLIVPNELDDTVSVLLNTTVPGATTSSFAAQQTFSVGNFPDSVTAADVNGDGLPDLIVANSNDNTVSVLLNTTAPGATTFSFATQQTFATGSSPNSVTAADVNGDGLPDLIVANQGDNTVSVLFNTTAPGATTPTFAAQQTFATGGQPRFGDGGRRQR
jgi:hypothetical protein